MSRADRSRAQSLLHRLLSAGLFDIFGAGVLNKVIAFVSGMVVVRLIPQEAYGVYAYAYNALSIILLFNGLGVVSAVLQLASERAFADRVGAVESQGVKVGFAFDALLSAGMLLAPLFVDFPVEGSGELFRLWAPYPFFQLVFDLQCVSLRASLRNREYALCTNLNTVAILIGSAAGAFAGGSVGLIVGRTLATLASCCVAAACFKVPTCAFSRDDGPRGELTAAERRSFLGISAVSALNAGVNQLVYYLGVAVLGAISSDAASVAVFQTMLAIPTALNFIPSALATFVYPYFARHKDEPEWVLRRFLQTLAASAAIAVPVALAVYALAPWAIVVLYGGDYASGAGILRILMLGWVFSATVRSIGSNLLVTQRRYLYGVVVAACSALLLVVFNLLFVPAMGSVGAAWAQVAVYVVSGFAYSAYFYLYVLRRKGRAAPIAPTGGDESKAGDW